MPRKVVGTYTKSVAFRAASAGVAKIRTGLWEVRALVDIERLALVAPAATVTLAGTAATAASVLESITVTPPAGARAFRTTVPLEGLPPVTLVESRATETRGECWNRPGWIQESPPFVLLKTPTIVPR